MKSDISDYDLIVVRNRKSERAILVKSDEESEAVWLPRSQVETEHDDQGLCSVSIPDWLAIEKGLA